MSVKLDWHGPTLLEACRNASLAGLNAGTQVLHTRCLQVVGVPNTGTTRRRKRGTGDYAGFRPTKGRNFWGHNKKQQERINAELNAERAGHMEWQGGGEMGQLKAKPQGSRIGSTYTIYASPSKPGEPPRKRTGWGQRNIQWGSNGNKLRPETRCGVMMPGIYMLYLELGTRHIAARHWLVVSVFAFRPEIVAAIEMASKAEMPK